MTGTTAWREARTSEVERAMGLLLPRPRSLEEVAEEAAAALERQEWPCSVESGWFATCTSCGAHRPLDNEAAGVVQMMTDRDLRRADLSEEGCTCMEEEVDDMIREGLQGPRIVEAVRRCEERHTLYFARNGYAGSMTGPYTSRDEAADAWSDDEEEVREQQGEAYTAHTATAVSEAVEAACGDEATRADYEALVEDEERRRRVAEAGIRSIAALYREGVGDLVAGGAG